MISAPAATARWYCWSTISASSAASAIEAGPTLAHGLPLGARAETNTTPVRQTSWAKAMLPSGPSYTAAALNPSTSVSHRMAWPASLYITVGVRVGAITWLSMGS